MSEVEKTSKTSFFKNVKSEFKKCTWPKKEDLAKQSALVITVSVCRHRLGNPPWVDSAEPCIGGNYGRRSKMVCSSYLFRI